MISTVSATTTAPSLTARISTKRTPRTKSPKAPEKSSSHQEVRFRKQDLDATEVASIFGPNVPVQLANNVLRIQHGRRLAGTLDSKPPFPKDSQYHATILRKALQWLRAKYPVDEDAAIQARVERELDAEEAEEGAWAPQQGLKGGNVYGKSRLEEIRKRNEEAWEAQAREVLQNQQEGDRISQEAEAETRNEGVTRGNGRSDMFDRGQQLTRAVQPANPKVEIGERREAWWHYYRDRAQISSSTEPPKLSMASLLTGPVLATLMTIGFTTFLASIYVPPPLSARLFPEIPPAAATILALVGLNVTIFVAWRLPPLWRSLNKYCIFVTGYPNAFSVLGNLFSHQEFRHLAFNMFVLWWIGTQLHEEITRAPFLALYLSSGAFATLSSHMHAVFTRNLVQASLGASGAIWGVISAFLILNWDRRFDSILIPEGILPSFTGKSLFIVMLAAELGGLIMLRRAGMSVVDHWSHLGGIGTGAVGAWWLGTGQKGEERRRWIQRREEERAAMRRAKEKRRPKLKEVGAAGLVSKALGKEQDN
ncbi:MAG: hypothetical protein M1833_006157 [Piccolia ochrophora]|nr:MAG: hypothetical protein M1833_006157 [Piccolia ochrophora]